MSPTYKYPFTQRSIPLPIKHSFLAKEPRGDLVHCELSADMIIRSLFDGQESFFAATSTLAGECHSYS
jgi:hypothetical protein